MQLANPQAEIFVPDDRPLPEALARTALLGIGAHQDDLEMTAFPGIHASWSDPQVSFGGVVVTNGSGSPRGGPYADLTDEEMQGVRRGEQKKAAVEGAYSFVALLDYPSAAVKQPPAPAVVADLAALCAAVQPRVIFTHNLADSHETHVAVALRVLEALRSLPARQRPPRLFGVEGWRDLDWLPEGDKVVFDLSAHEDRAAALVSLFDSQVAGGKRYDRALLARWQAQATFHSSHEVDTAERLAFGMDLTPLLEQEDLEPAAFVERLTQTFAAQVRDVIGRLSSG